MVCAPVVIPTLNRVEHLQRCISSLQRNKLAQETELYISVDYPPAEKYEEGYRKVCAYLSQPIEGFRKVHIFYQEKNLGPFDNSEFLEKKVLEKNDRMIYTEDDNCFSPNFLSYMNYNLEKYANDQSIYAINGYAYPIFKEHENLVYYNPVKFSAWGYGIWKNRCEEQKQFRKEQVLKYIKSFHNAKNIGKIRSNFIDAVYIARGTHYLAFRKNGDLYSIDKVINVYLSVTGKKVIMPAVSMVTNYGYDGSGVNCEKIDDETKARKKEVYLYNSQKVNDRTDYIPDRQMEVELSREEIRKLNAYFAIKKRDLWKAWILWLVKL